MSWKWPKVSTATLRMLCLSLAALVLLLNGILRPRMRTTAPSTLPPSQVLIGTSTSSGGSGTGAAQDATVQQIIKTIGGAVPQGGTGTGACQDASLKALNGVISSSGGSGCCGLPALPDGGAADAGGDSGNELLVFQPGQGLKYAPLTGDVVFNGPSPGGNAIAQFNGTPAIFTAPALDQVIQFNGTVWTNATLASSGTRAYYGSGVDGAVHLTTGTGSFAGGTCTSGACSLSRAAAYTTLLVDSGVTLSMAGSMVWATVSVTVNGVISADGSDASGTTHGAGAPHLFLVGGSDGGDGDSGGGGGAAGTTFNHNIGFGGTGGGGGTGSGSGATSGGAGGGLNNTASIPIQAVPSLDWIWGGISGVSSATGTPVPEGLGGGSGGGGGGCSGTNIAACNGGNGGGGGGGAGIVLISTPVCAGSGAIHARGGAGASGANNGGGGGGGGGTVIRICGDSAATYTGTVDENGGGAGTGGTPGVAGQSVLITGWLERDIGNDNGGDALLEQAA